MLTASILYVGEDICRRIPVIERCGARVRRTSCSARELGEVLRNTVQYSAVTFHEDLDPIPAEVLKVARSYPSPLVLFENPSMNYDPACFDLIIPALTPPGLWLRSIQDSINYSRELRARSQALRQETAAVRAEVCARLSACFYSCRSLLTSMKFGASIQTRTSTASCYTSRVEWIGLLIVVLLALAAASMGWPPKK